jgi:hypothetical protein
MKAEGQFFESQDHGGRTKEQGKSEFYTHLCLRIRTAEYGEQFSHKISW